MTKTVLICISILLVILAAFYGPKVTRLYKLANLYNEDKIASNFININKIFQVSEPIPSSNNPHSFPRRDFDLPDRHNIFHLFITKLIIYQKLFNFTNFFI